MGERRNRNAQNWATATSLIPIFGGNISQGILQRNLSRQQKEAADAINPVDVEYKVSDFAKEQLDNARQAANARMPGASAMENNLYRSQAGAMMNLARAATPQQLIAGAGAIQGGTNNALNNLAIQETQFRNSMLSNLNSALGVMINEGDKVYADQNARFNRQYAEKQGLLNSSQQNMSNSIANASAAMGKGVDIAMTLLGMPGGGGAGGTGGLGNLASLFGGGGAGKNIPSSGGATLMGSFNPANVGTPSPISPFMMPNLAGYQPRIAPYTP